MRRRDEKAMHKRSSVAAGKGDGSGKGREARANALVTSTVNLPTRKPRGRANITRCDRAFVSGGDRLCSRKESAKRAERKPPERLSDIYFTNSSKLFIDRTSRRAPRRRPSEMIINPSTLRERSSARQQVTFACKYLADITRRCFGPGKQRNFNGSNK